MYYSSEDLLMDIQIEINFISESLVDVDEDTFFRNNMMKHGIVKAIEIIGECSKKLNDEFKMKNISVDWKNIIGMRNRMVHDYKGTDFVLVFEIAKTEIPKLKTQIENILENKNF